MTWLRRVIRRGTWHPDIPHPHRRFLHLLVAVTPVMVGIDYLLGEPDRDLTLVERSAPPVMWGLAFVAAGTLALLGYALRYAWITIGGLHLSGALFVASAVGTFIDHADASGGFRVAWIYLMAAMSSWGIAVGYAGRRRKDDDLDP